MQFWLDISAPPKSLMYIRGKKGKLNKAYIVETVDNNIIITTLFPCWNCAELIVKNKLSKVFTYKRPLRGSWWDDEPVLKLFKNNKLEIYYD